MLLLVAPQRVFSDKRSAARVAGKGSRCIQFGPVPGADGLRRVTSSTLPCSSATFPTDSLLRLVRVALLFVNDQAAALLGGKAAEVTFKRSLLRVYPLVDLERPLARAGVSALGAQDGLNGLMLPRVLSQSILGRALEITVRALKGVFGAVLELNVRFEVAFHGTAILTEVTFVGLLPRVSPNVSLQVRVDFEFGVTLVALEWCVPLKKKNTINSINKATNGNDHGLTQNYRKKQIITIL